jgi:microcystin-dependent protein
MAEPFLAEIRIVPFNFAPTGWALCNGQFMLISQNTALFSLLGTYYGGDGKSNFALPNLQASAPLDAGQGPGLSYSAARGDRSTPAGAIWSKAQYGRQGVPMYTGGSPVAMNQNAIAPAGGDQPHNNLMPYLTLNFIIALQGVYPARN